MQTYNHDLPNTTAEILQTLTDLALATEDKIISVKYAGGMTNNNYLITLDDDAWFLRMPGRLTETMIDRPHEAINSKLASQWGLNVETIYINPANGIKVTRAVDHALTLGAKEAVQPRYRRKLAECLAALHQKEEQFENSFDMFSEWEKYDALIRSLKGTFYPGYEQAQQEMRDIYAQVERSIGFETRCCHNDLAPQNWIEAPSGKIYLLDWEYAGLNDPAFDLASLLLESEFGDEEAHAFLQDYYGRAATASEKIKVQMFEALQDVVWSAWTMAKEAGGDDFGEYGPYRFARGCQMIDHLKKELLMKTF